MTPPSARRRWSSRRRCRRRIPPRGSAYGSAETLGWLVESEVIEPHILVIDKSQRTDGTFSREDFLYDREADGRSFIGGGRKPLRDTLYMPALVALRFNPDLKAKYAELREAGKPAKVAIFAIMRELLETADALVKADRIWVEKRAFS